MRHLLVLCLLSLGLLSPLQANELRVALGTHVALPTLPVLPGKATPQGGGLIRFNEDVAEEICRRLHAHCKYSFIPFQDMLPGIEAGQIELGFGNFLRTPERDKRVAFSDSLWRSTSRLIGRPSSIQAYKEKAGAEPDVLTVRNVRVAVIAETQQHAYMKKVAEARSLTVIATKTMQEAQDLLRADQVDFTLMVVLSAYAMLGREPVGHFEFVGAPTAEHGLGGTVHIALPKRQDALRQSVNEALAAMRADGSYHRIMRRHFTFSLE